MQLTLSRGSIEAERKRVEAVVETLAAIHNHGESLGELAHDARNMVAALALYCDLLEEPGVLEPSHRHYGSELRLVAEASRRLVEKLALLGAGIESNAGQERATAAGQGRLFPEAPRFPLDALGFEPWSNGLIEDFREELLDAENLLDAMAGPSITLTLAAHGGAWPVQMTSENLVRALVNLVKNASESILGTGAIHLELGERRDRSGAAQSLVLSIEDSGRGIPGELLDKVFEPGFTTRTDQRPGNRWEAGHRGLGLSITRSIVEAAGGRIHAENRAENGAESGVENGFRQGARLVMELPVRRS